MQPLLACRGMLRAGRGALLEGTVNDTTEPPSAAPAAEADDVVPDTPQEEEAPPARVKPQEEPIDDLG